MRFEYLLVNKQTKEKALVQVKTGETPLNQKHYIQNNTQDMKDIKKIFLFQSNSRYTGKDEQNVISISPDTIRKFIEDSLDWLPEVFKTKSNLMKAIDK